MVFLESIGFFCSISDNVCHIRVFGARYVALFNYSCAHSLLHILACLSIIKVISLSHLLRFRPIAENILASLPLTYQRDVEIPSPALLES